jgi:tRNA pseudouridine55 synthase
MPTGILVLDKPAGLTSNGALQRVRRAFGAASAGHVGTLDPMATGMLPICLDEATKVIAEIESGAKCYEFTVQLGSRTDTGDREGVVVEERAVPALDPKLDEVRLEQVLARFRGVQSQVPPMYSALKREGRPLYELARQGIEVERNARTIEIRRLELVQRRADSLELVCECAKGTYIRVLGEDIAKALGTVGHLTSLRRLWVEPFRDVPMLTLDATLAGAADRSGLLSPDAALQALPSVGLSAPMAAAMRQGQAVTHAEAARSTGRRVRIYGPDGIFMGLAEALPDGRLQPRRLMRIDAP